MKRFLIFPLLILGVLLGLSGFIYTSTTLGNNQEQRTKQVKQQQQQLVQVAATMLEEKTKNYINLVENISQLLTTGATVAALDQVIKLNNLGGKNNVLGVGVAYLPQKNRRQGIFGHYWYRKSNRIIHENFDFHYLKRLHQNLWFKQVVAGGGGWSKPYYDSLLDEHIISYVEPFYLPNSKIIAGMVVLDIDIKGLEDIIAMSIGEKFASIISSDGYYIYDTKTQYIILNSNVNGVADVEHQLDKVVLQRVHNANCAAICSSQAQSNDGTHYLVYLKLKHIPWVLLADYSTQALEALSRVSDNRLTMLRIACVVLSLSCLIIINTLYRLRLRNLRRKLWSGSLLLSLIFIIAIIYIWNISTSLFYLDTSSAITNSLILDKYIQPYIKDTKLKNAGSFYMIPSGITINSIEFLSAYNIQITGSIMQTYPLGESINYGVKFNDAYEAVITQITAVDSSSQRTIIWNFQVKLREDFDYSHYPFNHGKINIALSALDTTKNIILIPNFTYYNGLGEINASAGVSSHIIIPGWQLKGTYFDFTEDNSRMLDAIDSYQTLQLPALSFNLIVGSTFSDALITTIIPPVVILFILFISLLMISRYRNRFLEFKVTGIMGATSGLLFIIVFTHVSLRNKLTAEIMYIEYFYVLMYIVLLFLPINALLFGTRSSKLIAYGNNIIFKLLFLPLVSSYILTLSLWSFS
jgi:hypothetical protein